MTAHPNRLDHRLRLMLRALCGAALLGGAALAAPALPGQDPVPARPTASALPEGWQQGVFMEIFVRAYQDSNGDGIGDLRGLISRLDHLKSLGISGLWLMPITASADHDHGYATTDFRAIEPQYGTLEDFDELIRQAHRRGIGVVMDYVVNHASYQHAAFQAALADPKSPWRDWFVWNADPQQPPQGWDIWGKNPWYDAALKPWEFKGELKDLAPPRPGARDVFFGTFGPHMPDFNLRNPAVVRYHEDSLRFWLNRGLDGFRLDAVPHLIENSAEQWNDQPESRALTKRLQDLIKSYPNRYVVCEATAKPQDYGDPALCGGAFAFGLQYEIIKAAQGDASAAPKVLDYYRTMAPTMATFLHNHDIFTGRRVWDQLKGQQARYQVAAASYLLLPGTPFVYYGEEIGMAGTVGAGDTPLRAPMSWNARGGFSSAKPFRAMAPNVARFNVAMQAADPRSLLNFYKTMIALRNQRPSLAHGSFDHALVHGQVLAFQRVLGDERSLVLINYGDRSQQVLLEHLPSHARLQALYPSASSPLGSNAQGRSEITVPAHSLRVYALHR